MTCLSSYKSATVVNDNGEIGIVQRLNLKQPHQNNTVCTTPDGAPTSSGRHSLLSWDIKQKQSLRQLYHKPGQKLEHGQALRLTTYNEFITTTLWLKTNNYNKNGMKHQQDSNKNNITHKHICKQHYNHSDADFTWELTKQETNTQTYWTQTNDQRGINIQH